MYLSGAKLKMLSDLLFKLAGPHDPVMVRARLAHGFRGLGVDNRVQLASGWAGPGSN